MEGEELEPQDVKLAHILQEDAQRQRDNALENDSHSKSPHPSASAEVSQAGASPAPNNSAESPSHRDLEMKTKNPRQSTGSTPSDVEITGEQATLAANGQQQVSRETPALEPPSAQAVSSGRALPSRVITEETIDRAYAEFILYCNPNIPADVDTFELCRTFRSPPRCEGRGFAMFKLWELIKRLDRKEVKFWSQLAHELLAVDPSDSRRQGISTKVHQYGGRLKVCAVCIRLVQRLHCSVGWALPISMHSSNIALVIRILIMRIFRPLKPRSRRAEMAFTVRKISPCNH